MANLPIPDEDSWAIFESHTGTGPFTFNFSIFGKNDLVVLVNDVAVDQNAFSLIGSRVDSGYDGGSVVLTTPVVAARVVVYRNVTPERTTDFSPSNTVPVKSIDAELDRLTAMAQDARRDIGRTILSPIGETAALELPSVADRAGKLLGFDLDGAFTVYDLSDGGGGAFLPLVGGDLIGALTGTTAVFSGVIIAATPTLSTHLATKGYADLAITTAAALLLAKAGGTMTGNILLAGDGTAPLHPVTRQQLDAAIIGAGGGAVDSVNGLTGTVVLTKSSIGLANVDNTTDVAKPISALTQTALDLKAPLASPTFTGTVTTAAVSVSAASSTTGTVTIISASGTARALGVYGAGPASDSTRVFTVERDGATVIAGTAAILLDATASGGNRLRLSNASGLQITGSATISDDLTVADDLTVSNRIFATGTVTGATPTTTGHLTTKGYVDALVSATSTSDRAYADSVAGAPAGFFDVVRGASTGGSVGRMDLTGYGGKTVRLLAGLTGDNNIWEIVGMSVGQWAFVKVAVKYQFLFVPPGFYSGSTVLRGNFQAVVTGHNNLAVGPDDTLMIVCTAANTFEVHLLTNQFESRVDWAGSAREPSATYHAIGMVVPFNESLNVVGGDFLTAVNGTSRKPYSGGHFFVGIGDTCGSFTELYKAKDAEEGEGLSVPRYAIPHTDVGVMSTHYQTLRTKVYGADGTTLIFPDLPPAGWVTGPGSILGQGWVTQLHFHHSAVPTRQSTPGGHTVRVVPFGQTTVIARQMTGHDGANWFPGKASMEAAGTLAELAPYLDLSNIPQWNIPSLAWSTLDDGYGNITVLLTDANDPDCDFFAGAAFRIWNSQASGFDIFYRPDESTIWLGAVDAGLRYRGIGFHPGLAGHVTTGGGDEGDFTHNQDIQFQLVDSTVKSMTFRSQKFGYLVVTDQDGHTAIFSVSGDTNQTRLLTCSDSPDTPSASTLWGNTINSAGKMNVYVTGQNTVNFQNKRTVTKSFKVASKL